MSPFELGEGVGQRPGKGSLFPPLPQIELKLADAGTPSISEPSSALSLDVDAMK